MHAHLMACRRRLAACGTPAGSACPFRPCAVSLAAAAAACHAPASNGRWPAACAPAGCGHVLRGCPRLCAAEAASRISPPPPPPHRGLTPPSPPHPPGTADATPGPALTRRQPPPPAHRATNQLHAGPRARRPVRHGRRYHRLGAAWPACGLCAKAARPDPSSPPVSGQAQDVLMHPSLSSARSRPACLPPGAPARAARDASYLVT